MQQSNEANLEQTIANFVYCYYSILVSNRASIRKFYAEDAQFWRQSMKIMKNVGVKTISDIDLFPYITIGFKLGIISYHGIPLPNGYNVFVEGVFQTNDASQRFSQAFTLIYVQNRQFIYADSLTFIKVSTETCVQEFEALQLRTETRKSKNASRFLPYTPPDYGSTPSTNNQTQYSTPNPVNTTQNPTPAQDKTNQAPMKSKSRWEYP